MNTQSLYACTTVVLLGVTQLIAPGAIAAPALTEASRVSTQGIGPVRIGMTLSQAEAAAGRKFKRGEVMRSCEQVDVQGLEGVSFMLIKGKVERIDVRNPKILTLSGAKIGDTETQIKQRYPGKIKVTPSESSRAVRHLTFHPADRQDNHRVMFQVRDDNQVFSYRAGRLPAVAFDDGCA